MPRRSASTSSWTALASVGNVRGSAYVDGLAARLTSTRPALNAAQKRAVHDYTGPASAGLNSDVYKAAARAGGCFRPSALTGLNSTSADLLRLCDEATQAAGATVEPMVVYRNTGMHWWPSLMREAAEAGPGGVNSLIGKELPWNPSVYSTTIARDIVARTDTVLEMRIPVGYRGALWVDSVPGEANTPRSRSVAKSRSFLARTPAFAS